MPHLLCLPVIGNPANASGILLVQLDPAFFLYKVRVKGRAASRKAGEADVPC